MPPSNPTLRSAVVGTGKIAAEHVQAVQRSTGAVITAACDVDQMRLRAFGAAHGIPALYASLEEMLEREEPDLVHVCTPPGTHTEITIACLSHGAWVLCEKPLCGSLADVDRIQEAEKRSGAYCATVAQLRFGAAAQHVRGLIDSGELGAPRVAICNTLWYRDRTYYEVPWRGRWHTEMGGVTLNLGIHEIDLLLWLLGDWDAVRAVTRTLQHDIEVEDVSFATLEFASGAIASIVSSVLSPREESYLRIDCDEGTVELRHLYGYGNEDLLITRRDGTHLAADRLGWNLISGDVRGEIATQVAEVVRARSAGVPPPISTAEARRTIDLMASLYKSSAVNQSIGRGSIAPQDPFYRGMSTATCN